MRGSESQSDTVRLHLTGKQKNLSWNSPLPTLTQADHAHTNTQTHSLEPPGVETIRKWTVFLTPLSQVAHAESWQTDTAEVVVLYVTMRLAVSTEHWSPLLLQSRKLLQSNPPAQEAAGKHTDNKSSQHSYHSLVFSSLLLTAPSHSALNLSANVFLSYQGCASVTSDFIWVKLRFQFHFVSVVSFTKLQILAVTDSSEGAHVTNIIAIIIWAAHFLDFGSRFPLPVAIHVCATVIISAVVTHVSGSYCFSVSNQCCTPPCFTRNPPLPLHAPFFWTSAPFLCAAQSLAIKDKKVGNERVGGQDGDNSSRTHSETLC